MTHKLIHTPNHLLVVDDSEIKGWYYDRFIKKVKHSGGAEYGKNTLTKSIISHLPLNDSPILEGVALLPPLEQEDDVERLIKIEQEASYKQGKGTISWYEQEKRKEYYNKAKEKYKYTEEDLRKAIDMAQEQERVTYTEDYRHTFNADEIIQSLSQPKMPVGFECEESVFFATNAFSSDITLTSEGLQDTVLKGIKTTTNSRGQTVWVGKYIF
jgi:hypothetical protein